MELIKNNMTEADLAPCAQLYANTFSQAPWNEPWTAHDAHQRLEHMFASLGAVGVCLYSGDNLIGFVLGNTEPFLAQDLFYLREMCVKAEEQGSGIGTALMESLMVSLKQQGVGSIYLSTSPTSKAHVFYKKLGFKAAEDMAFMVKRV